MSLISTRKTCSTSCNYALLPEPGGAPDGIRSLSILAVAKITDSLHWHMVCWNVAVGTVFNKIRRRCSTQSHEKI
jgi:hypothetical protein